jgi:hypothetical protein
MRVVGREMPGRWGFAAAFCPCRYLLISTNNAKVIKKVRARFLNPGLLVVFFNAASAHRYAKDTCQYDR